MTDTITISRKAAEILAAEYGNITDLPTLITLCSTYNKAREELLEAISKPVKQVVMPERATVYNTVASQVWCNGWNAYADEYARLNGIVKP